ncbi:uncharacterized protein E0L32_002338 [Thyridium curvatum]|uniref:Aminoglycoside phosphotransferase domain-containing protein n=1 Tax=Thyridium curvatum TaxID=1093900 RepID=A0A507AEL6_9PEZI|nr:uncharacterized protein E0L32_002338 [Thyridium curvatum]TPX06842.1 hypothetical protein E0L32_002338 [Thyridium curvatum]
MAPIASSPSSSTSLSNSRDAQPSSVSETSTIYYDQEPFETFQGRALFLALSTIWANAAADEVIAVERLHGGGYNRITGLTKRTMGKPETALQYILRVPRFQPGQVGNEVAALRFVLEQTSIPAPSVVAFDETSLNQLQSPYMIQTRLPGVPLHQSMADMSYSDRCRIAKDLGAVVGQMLQVQSSMSGRLTLPSTDRTLVAPLHVAPWYPVVDPSESQPFRTSAASSSVGKMLTAALLAWKAEELRLRPRGGLKPDIIDQFIIMARQMEKMGYLGDTPFTLAHLDLAPRNILINDALDTSKPIISGILDWDSAVLGPMFMTCDPPSWVWAEWGPEGDEEEKDEDKLEADLQPSSAQALELKSLFDATAGPHYRKLAYDQKYSLSRRLMRFVIQGMASNELINEARALLRRWKIIWDAKHAESDSQD